ncbi:MAG: 30S ribosomal protein S1 [Leptolyngbyaceae cyanobacterium SL_1_1]|nr:30S ribosomal protein S1 [Leptolyngbyaceae cyanobacterium RM2_2_21]NJN04815.1 30S ribosomal protein S1 [Leptolyngbyaceae cyanobacterium RM1_1_2]NJO11138.1 30S ribosomal protein S1 [Leptolyngbyaceae cyanobacterium SL_1_1]
MSFSAEDFARALEQHDYQFQKGSVVQGTVFSHTDKGAYVDIGGKAAAFLPLQEAALQKILPEQLLELLPLEESRKFMIVRDQDADGQVLLSIRQMQIKQLWQRLSQMQADNETLEVTLNGTNKGGVLADVDGLRAFIPRSHLRVRTDDLESLIGQTLTVAFLEVSPDSNKLVLSERIAARAVGMSRLEVGQLIQGIVANIKPFGVFVEFEGVTGLLHVNQVSKNYVDSLPNLFQVGQSIKAVVVNIDEANHRISLSTKVLESFPGEMLHKQDELMADAENRLQSLSKVLAEADI